ncbi:MAG: 16S rRNA (cytidine(1402)-2'-O)-methyltransferase [Patescibacteria group bacterium]|nr:16S rRNA (cytidine(1402)-2'-O)-methyltransferase [Patescibacteria group bacterium]
MNCKIGTLYVVATPIGNLEDITLRALKILKMADFVLCEDTRVTSKLLSHYEIKSSTISCHHHSDLKKINHILDLLEHGKNLALVSDAGTPTISDPGGKLIEAIIKKFGNTTKIEPIPGPSAVIAALSIAGVPADKFIFLGFPPHKKGRQKFLGKIANSEITTVVYESKHRIIKFLEELNLIIEQKREVNEKFNFKIIVCRELTKMHETIYRGNINDILKKIRENKQAQKGEFVVVIAK